MLGAASGDRYSSVESCRSIASRGVVGREGKGSERVGGVTGSAGGFRRDGVGGLSGGVLGAEDSMKEGRAGLSGACERRAQELDGLKSGVE